ncbi:DNA cytosine methyltransferase [Brevundimonas aurantiaca]|uniref:DNA cytosine methyltransferase n=1 Tax=Brevundimonas aurantiaca TaxID=74316 RepID=UPI001D192996|nr:DNA cytosine methyltransferase [Brevundimonas aurantiaca]MCC4295839.1 DNA cytosine methyltransferase [Brevundimonas aurantiaca]
MNFVSLFAGIGGFDLGLERAGMTAVAQCEISPKCRYLLRQHWPEVQQFEDVCTMRAADVPHRVRLICGGFPCQDISFAGKGAGLAGERSGLWREYARLIGEFRPDYVVVENVAALLGRGLGDVLGDLASLGYDAWWDCIPASAVGAPHRRDRLWIVAYPRSEQYQGYGDALRREIAKGLSRALAEQSVLAGDDSQADAFNPDSDRFGSHCPGIHVVGDAELRDEQVGLFEPMGEDVANAQHLRPVQPEGCFTDERGRIGDGSCEGGWKNLGYDADRFQQGSIIKPCERQNPIASRNGKSDAGRRPAQSLLGRVVDGLPAWLDGLSIGWAEEPPVPRVAKGVPARSDRLHGLGNAVVPAIPEIIGRAILAAEAEMTLPANQNTAQPKESAA